MGSQEPRPNTQLENKPHYFEQRFDPRRYLITKHYSYLYEPHCSIMLFLVPVAFYNSSRLQQTSGSLEVRITPLRIVTVTSLGQFDHIGPFQREFEDWWDPGKWLVSKRFSPLCPVDAKWMRTSELSTGCLALFVTHCWYVSGKCCQLFVKSVCGLMVLEVQVCSDVCQR